MGPTAAFGQIRVMNTDILATSELLNSESSLNPNAPAFVPGGGFASSGFAPSSFATNSWRESSPNKLHREHEADSWPSEPQYWLPGFACYGNPDDAVARALELEDAMRDRLYRAPQQPKGNTSGRARVHGGPRHEWHP